MCVKLHLLVVLIFCLLKSGSGQYEALIANAKKIGLNTFVKLPEPAIAGDIDDRIVVYGMDGMQHSACNVADDKFQWERWGFGTICQCSKIEYNAAGLNRTPSDISSELDPGDGATGGALYTDGTYVDSGLTYIEAGVCVPGPCCEQQYFKSRFPMPWTRDKTTPTIPSSIATTVTVITTPAPTSVLTETSTESTIATTTTLATTATAPTSTPSIASPTTLGATPNPTASRSATTNTKSVSATSITTPGTVPTTVKTTVSNSGISTTVVTVTSMIITTSPTTKTAQILLPVCAHPYPWPKTLEAAPPAKFNMTCQYYPDQYYNPKDACKRMAPISEWGYGPYLIYCCSFKWPKNPTCEGPQFPPPVIR